MQLEQLNEFNFFKSNNKKKPYKKNGDFIEIDLSDSKHKKDKITIIKLKKGDGYPKLIGNYRVFIRARAHTFKIINKDFDKVVKDTLKYLETLQKKAKSGKTETAPADLPTVTLKDFKEIKKILDK